MPKLTTAAEKRAQLAAMTEQQYNNYINAMSDAEYIKYVEDKLLETVEKLDKSEAYLKRADALNALLMRSGEKLQNEIAALQEQLKNSTTATPKSAAIVPFRVLTNPNKEVKKQQS